jgi:hypothetical protein
MHSPVSPETKSALAAFHDHEKIVRRAKKRVTFAPSPIPR